jgi:hypothetical protein
MDISTHVITKKVSDQLDAFLYSYLFIRKRRGAVARPWSVIGAHYYGYNRKHVSYFLVDSDYSKYVEYMREDTVCLFTYCTQRSRPFKTLRVFRGEDGEYFEFIPKNRRGISSLILFFLLTRLITK